MFKSLSHISRLISIGRVLAKHDALFLFEEWNIAPNLIRFLKLTTISNSEGRDGERLANALQELGPAFVKLGQALSTRSDFLGDDVAQDLALLRDKLPPFDSDKAIEVIEEELGKSIRSIYKKFDKKPIAAASIAQVHFAEDRKGNKLAIKVLRPDVEAKFKKDVELLYWLAGQVEKRIPSTKRFKLNEVVKVFSDTVSVEMDFRLEAAAAEDLKENFANDGDVVIPKIHWDKTARRVLTMERIQGISLGDEKALKRSKHKPKDIVKKISTTLFKMAFRDGLIHADMHPGNIFIDRQGRLVLVDFGIMGRLDKESQIFIAEMLYAFMNKDFEKVSKMHFVDGIVPDTQSEDTFTQACRSIAEPILGLPQNEISIAKLLSQLFKVAEDFEMNLQPQFLMLQKAIMLAEGVSRKIYPKVNMWKLAEPLVEEWANENLGPEAKIKEGLKNFKKLGDKVEALIKSIEYCITPDGIRFHPDTVAVFEKIRKCRKN